jgi:OHCU decarboxylase
LANSYQIYKNLAWLNDLAPDDAIAAFLDCCGSNVWAERMTNARPFRMLDDLFDSARRIWFSLSPADWLEAFATHPKIGSSSASGEQSATAGSWSAEEQSQVYRSDPKCMDELAEANRLYQKKFGFIFIVFAHGKTAEEMLAICKARYGNSVETELQLAAEEQNKITELRLTRLLER